MATPRKTKAAKAPPPAKPAKKKTRPPPAKTAAPKRAADSGKKAPAKAAKGKPQLKTPLPPKKPATKSAATKKPAGRTIVPPKAAAPTVVEPHPAVLDPELLKAIREALVNQQRQIVSAVQTTKAQMAEKVGDLPDVSDRASEGYINELAVGLLAIEAAQLDEIEAAIRRIDEGRYGLCIDCGKPIPSKRLEVLPFAQRCLSCKGVRERGMPTRGGYSENHEEDDDRD